MADLVTSNVIFNGNKRYKIQLTSVSDGTGEAAVVKIDISALVKANGEAPTKVKIDRVQYSVTGMSVKIGFAHTSPDYVLVLSGSGEKDFRSQGGLVDPASAGSTGDVILTTVAHASSDTYDITLEISY